MDLLRDHLPEPRLLGEPFTRESGNRVPTNLNGSRLSGNVDLARRYNVWLVAQSEGLLELKFSLQEFLFPFGKTSLPL